MDFLMEENLDAKYEEWNSIVDLETYMYPHYKVTRETAGNHISASSPKTLEEPSFQEQILSSMDFNEDLGDILDVPLDDIDTDSLFYKKSFTELTPVKSELGVHDILLGPQHFMPGNVCTRPDGLSFDSSNVDIPQDFSSLCNFNTGSTTHNLYNNNQPFFCEEGIAQDFRNSGPHHQQEFVPEMMRNKQFFVEPSHDSQMPLFQSDFEQPHYINNSSNLIHSEYNNFGSPKFEMISNCDAQQEFIDTASNISSDSCSSLQDEFLTQATHEFGESAWVKEIKVGKNNRPRGPKCWEFLLRLLKDKASNPSLVKWEDPEIGSFKLVEKDKISAIWGNRPSKKKNGKVIKYESFARILRYHYKNGKGMVLPVSEKHLVYKFASKVMIAYRAGKTL